jgi:hypothetical protein
MLNKKNVALLGAMAVAAIASTSAQAATETANAEVDIIAAVQLTQNDPLDFGMIASGAAGGTVTLPAATGTRNCGGLVCVGTATRGRFTVNGTIGQNIAITLPSTVTLTSSGNSMVVSLSPVPTIAMTTASQEFFIGGSLAVNPSQPAGAYTATYPVTAEYQ